jgi:hypothetical protein
MFEVDIPGMSPARFARVERELDGRGGRVAVVSSLLLDPSRAQQIGLCP